ncbi:MAG: hypothetical protein F6K00_17545 [Leptolyngbya sp. SIOISBB]|nr:hypothetical protein [Leptolyngbya sp. SIOISBB]
MKRRASVQNIVHTSIKKSAISRRKGQFIIALPEVMANRTQINYQQQLFPSSVFFTVLRTPKQETSVAVSATNPKYKTSIKGRSAIIDGLK